MNYLRYRQWPVQGNQYRDELRQAFDRLFDGSLFGQDETDDSSVVTSQWVPRVDVKEEKDRFVLYADLPGIDPDDIEVSMDKGILTIKGERSSESTRETDRFSRIERSYGSFHRRFALPDSADPEGIQAHGRNGVLEIVIPKRPEAAPRRIQVGRHEGAQAGRTIDAPATQQ
ncbi:MAG TPA: Hsp20/alpha crystallin family protein [Xanthomonadaceae bacterium]|nr:Hsp20/alpha crystallin family protein [Xanthomonadaceae bacterium]